MGRLGIYALDLSDPLNPLGLGGGNNHFRIEHAQP